MTGTLWHIPSFRLPLILAGLFLLIGCSAGFSPSPSIGTRVIENAFTDQVNPAVFDVGLRRIENVYVDAVDLGTVVTDGLNGFSSLDPALEVVRADSAVSLRYAGTLIRSVSEASDRDSRGWSSIVSLMVNDAQEVSPTIADAGPEEIYTAFFDAMLEDLDGYSRYSSADRARVERASRDGYGGVGLLLETEDDGSHWVRDVFEEGPAAAAGVVSDSQILAIDGVSTADMEIQEVGDRVRGPVDSQVQLLLNPPGGGERSFTITRDRVIQDTVSIRYEGDVAILRISRFNAATAADLVEALGEISIAIGEPEGLILDLRGNPGGLLDQSVDVADVFIPRGEIIHTQGRHPDSRQAFNARIRDLMQNVPMVVLMDGNSASGAEVVAAALQDVGRAVVVGASSFGKGSVQTVTRLPNNGELFLTWSRIFVPSGYSFHEQGVLPSVCTSTGFETAGEVVRAFRSGELQAPARLHTFRERAHLDEQAREILRTACPWREHDEEMDVDVALSLLNDPALFQQALAAADVGVSVVTR